MMSLSRVLLPVLVLVAACTQAPPAATLEGRTFLSTAVTEDGAKRDLVVGTRIRLSFTDGRIGASAGCNIFGGEYRISNGTLIVTGGAMTEMGCDEDRSAQDEWLFAFLGSSPAITLDGDDLTLASGGTVITLLDKEIADPDLQLGGPLWTVTTIFSGGSASSIADVVATLQFKADGTVEVNTGCNSGGGRYAVAGSAIHFSEIFTTLRGCGGAAGQMEAAVLTVLSAGSVEFALDASSLTLMAGNQGLGLVGTTAE